MANCACLHCEFGRALNADPLDRERLTNLWNAVLEHGLANEMSDMYLVENVERFCGRLDAPEYLREALRVTKDERRKEFDAFMGRVA